MIINLLDKESNINFAGGGGVDLGKLTTDQYWDYVKKHPKTENPDIIAMEDLKTNPSDIIDLTRWGINVVEGKINSDITSLSFYSSDKLKRILIFNIPSTNLTSLKELFKYCGHLIQIEGFNNIDTSNVTDMTDMFNSCSSLNSLDLSSFNTSNVTNMSAMFVGCSSLNNLDLSSFNTSNVTDMTYMFNGCSSLNSLDLSSFNTSNVTDMSYMLANCSSLNNLDLSSFNTSNVTIMSGMFRGSGLKSLDLSKWNKDKVNNYDNMFNSCSSLIEVNLSNDNGFTPQRSQSMFNNCSSLVKINLSGYDQTRMKYGGGKFDGCTSLKYIMVENCPVRTKDQIVYQLNNDSGDLGGTFQKSPDENIIYKTNNVYDIITQGSITTHEYTNVELVDELFTSKNGEKPYNAYRWADNSSIGTRMSGPEKIWVYRLPENCTSLEKMFYVSNAKEIVMKCDTSNISEGYELFQTFSDCTKLEKLDVADMDVSKVKYFTSAFFNCKTLHDLDISKWNVDAAINANYMFANCENLSVLIGPFQTDAELGVWPALQSAANMFENTAINQGSLGRGRNLVDARDMFKNCVYMTDVYSRIFEGKYTDLFNGSGMFEGCENLTEVDLQEFYPSMVRKQLEDGSYTSSNFSRMFYGCTALTNLDLSRFGANENKINTFVDKCIADECDMTDMFTGCSSLQKVKIYNTKDTNEEFHNSTQKLLDLLNTQTGNTDWQVSSQGNYLYRPVIEDPDSTTEDSDSTTTT